MRRLSPRRLRRSEFRLPSGTAIVSAIAAPVRSECVISIIVPIFNERATIAAMMSSSVRPETEASSMMRQFIAARRR